MAVWVACTNALYVAVVEAEALVPLQHLSGLGKAAAIVLSKGIFLYFSF